MEEGKLMPENTTSATPSSVATPQPEPESSREEMRKKITALADQLRRAEAKTVSGAGSQTPKQRLLSVSTIEKANPDWHYRYVNMTDPEKVKLRRDRGYVPVSDEEAKKFDIAARHGNDLVLMKIPRADHEKRLAELDAVNYARLNAHKAEVAGAAERIVRELKDKHGIDMDLNRFLVSD
jgi:hypothetical protein